MAATTTISPKTTRLQRGIALYREHAGEIERFAPYTYSVPSCSGGTTYTVRLDRERCDCPDYERHRTSCKHIYAASVAAAKAKARRWSA